MEKKNREEEFIQMFKQALAEVKKMESLNEITLSSDASFGGIVRQFGKGNILHFIAMLAASEIHLVDFSEEQINKKLMEVLKEPVSEDLEVKLSENLEVKTNIKKEAGILAFSSVSRRRTASP